MVSWIICFSPPMMPRTTSDVIRPEKALFLSPIDSGGIVGMLALHGIFVLVTQHGTKRVRRRRIIPPRSTPSRASLTPGAPLYACMQASSIQHSTQDFTTSSLPRRLPPSTVPSSSSSPTCSCHRGWFPRTPSPPLPRSWPV